MSRRPLTPLLVLLLLALAAAPLWSQDHPNVEKGFNPERTFQVGDVDQVNLFNGNLLLTLPLGQSYPVGGGLSYRLTLVYNSQLWEFQTRADTNLNTEFTQGRPSRRANAGMGWAVSLGRLLPPSAEGNDTGVWVYVGPDGASHNFYARLHHGDDEDPGDSGAVWDAAQKVQYTRDGSYLRLVHLPSGEHDLELSNGEVHRFDPDGWLLQIRTRKVDDNGAPVNWVAIAYQREWDPVRSRMRDVQWTISDSQGRSHQVLFRHDLPEYLAVISKVQLQGFGGTAEYSFGYDTATVARSCPHDELPAVMSPNVTAPFLTSLTLPDGSSYAMPLADYQTAPPLGLGICQSSGAIRGLKLPTLGKLEWDYQKYSFTNATAPKPPRSHTAGVGERRVKDASGTVLGTWTYATALAPAGAQAEELVNTVTDQLSHRTVHYFSVFASQTSVPAGWSPFEYGLPFTRRLTGGASSFLSNQVFHANGTLLRSTYVRYEMDQRNPTAGNVERNLNRRQAYQRTVYHDDGGVFAETASSDFDGLGHYRQMSTGGNFGAGDVQTVRTSYNPGVGTYQLGAGGTPLAGFTMLPPAAPWVLGTYKEREVTEGPEGTARVRSQYCFNPATGFLERERTLRDADAPGATDVLVVYTPDGADNVEKEETYGGDDGGVGAAAGGDLCDPELSLPAAQYRLDHTYAFGVLRTSRYFNPGNGAALPFLAVDRDIHPTGLVSVSRDAAGLATAFEYDRMGRPTWVKPAAGHGGWTEYAYGRALSASDLADVTVRRRGNGSKTAPVLAQSQILLDSLGRVWREVELMHDGNSSVRETLYDGVGNRASVSEAQIGDPDKKTQFLGYDPFGRAATVRPPDGMAHDVTFTYAGVRSVERKVSVGTSQTAGVVTEAPAKTTETYDRQGRLWQVTEPSGANGSNVTTTYSYDPAGRLTKVSTPATVAGATVVQQRIFDYDDAGFLQWERHPEKGASGNGTVHYFGYDARGHARRKVDGPHDLTFVYDKAERLVEIRETAGDQRLLKTFTYAANNGAGDWKKGKVVEASRYQYPLLGGGPVPVQVKETYAYGGRDGRVSRRDTQLYVNQAAKESFTQGFEHDALGQVRTLDYPVCLHAECAQSGGAVFQDVPPGHPAKAEIEALFNGGITTGCAASPLTYCPGGTVTRAQMAVFLLRTREGQSYQPPACTVQPFNDVPCSYWAAAWIAELVRRGITSGCGGGNYCPESPVSQAQMAVFLLSTRDGLVFTPLPCTAPTYADVPCGHWAAPWIEELTRRGISSGCGNGSYCPDAPVSRAEMAVLLVRTFDLPVTLSPGLKREVLNTYSNGFLTRIGNYAIALNYHPNGMVHQIGRGNGLLDMQENDANGLRRPASITTFAGGATRWTTGAYAYDGAGNVTEMGDAWFFYDKVSRLVSAKLFLSPNGQGTAVQQGYTFDPFGNLTQVTGTGGRNISTNPNTNRISAAGISYDAAGNLKTWNGASYVYDAFNQMERMTSGSEDLYYLYTADDERFWTYKPATGSTTNSSRWTLRDLNGLVLREYTSQNASWSVAADYIYRDGLLLAAETPAGVRHFHLDHLGTPRLITDRNAQQTAYHVYYPFGEEATAVNQDAERMKFTGHERDLAVLGNAADDLDYMHARHYSPLTGRFLSVDPIQGETKNPRSWNLYSYVFNRPLSYSDPLGLSGWRFDDSITVVGKAMTEGLDLVIGRFMLNSIQWMTPERKLTLALALSTAVNPSAYQGKPLINLETTEGVTVSMMPLTPGSFASAGRILGRNPRLTRGRVNTDLSGGRPVAKSIFRRLTKGEKIIEETGPDGTIFRYNSDRSVQLRLNTDGTSRIDIVGNSSRGRETIHFD